MTELAPFLSDLAALKAKYVELQDISRREPGVIAAGDLSLLQRLVDHKQKIMAEVDAISSRTQQWRQAAGPLAPDDREAVNRAVEEAQKELQALLKVEDESRRALESRRDDTSDKIQKISKGKKARDLYGGGTAGGRFIDRGS